MSGLDPRRALFYTAAEVEELFRRERGWAYKAAHGLLRDAVRRFGRKHTLFLRSVVDRIAEEGAPAVRPGARSFPAYGGPPTRQNGRGPETPDEAMNGTEGGHRGRD